MTAPTGKSDGRYFRILRIQNGLGAEKNYKGRVKSVKISEFKLTEKFGELVREGGAVQSFKYDEKGNKLEMVEYDAYGKITYKYTYKYDEKGNKLEEVKSDADGKITYKYTAKYDEKGNKVNETNYDLKTDFGEKRFVPTKELTWEFTYWN